MEKLLNYLKTTPHNTNFAIVKQMINDLMIPVYEVSYEPDVARMYPELDAIVEHIKNNENYVLKIDQDGTPMGYHFYEEDFGTGELCIMLIGPELRRGIGFKNPDGTWTLSYVGA